MSPRRACSRALLPALFYDGDCAFCSRVISGLVRAPRRQVNVYAWQGVDLGKFDIGEQRAAREMLWVHGDGRVTGGSMAFADLFDRLGGPWRVPALLLRIPPTSWLAAGVYRVIARNRHRMPGGTAACALPRR
ncbi:DUF393 domain-containing protein [Streptomyces sp. SID2563]|uniref:DCC1-like thiol-disulfide oxidoreductase family protein n=1 Tax=Streptomyces sp. SID2563 TaxID=2690255 RepID=UPI00136B3260|nr:DUF393 domain-containing protein [Streptomyces sp. SID2563]